MSLLYDASANLVRRVYDRRLSGPPVLDAATHFPDARRFYEPWRELRDEALAVMDSLQSVPRFHELMPSQAEISANDGRDWRMLVLKAYGVPVRQNMARCPRLAAIADPVPDVLSATLSFLAPGKHIPRHRGPFRGVIRFYLGLSVPVSADGQPAAVLTVDDVDHPIGDGQWLLWDDTYPHEVWNRSDQVRIALLLDVRRRGMPPDLEVLTRVVVGAVSASVRIRKLVEGTR
jgi:aspartate beta-hydroxylase